MSQTSEKEDTIRVEGKIVDLQRGDLFKVSVDGDRIITCKPSGKIRQHKIKLVPGDLVDVEISVYDLNKGRIVYRRALK